MPMSVAYTSRIFLKLKVWKFGYHGEHPCNCDYY